MCVLFVQSLMWPGSFSFCFFPLPCLWVLHRPDGGAEWLREYPGSGPASATVSLQAQPTPHPWNGLLPWLLHDPSGPHQVQMHRRISYAESESHLEPLAVPDPLCCISFLFFVFFVILIQCDRPVPLWASVNDPAVTWPSGCVCNRAALKPTPSGLMRHWRLQLLWLHVFL